MSPMGAVRLARFNATVSTSDSKYFTGLAIPAAAGVIASLVIFDLHITQMGSEVKPLLILVITFALAFLMVSTIKYRSFKDMKFRRGDHFTYLVWGILALMLIVAWPQAMLFVTFTGYALSGPIARLWTMVTQERRQAGGEERFTGIGFERVEKSDSVTRSSRQS